MAYGENYVPNPWSNVPPTACPNIFWAYGSGAPTCTGFPNQGYIDIASGDIYQYQNGAWVLINSGVGSGGGGTTEIATGASDPVGAPAAGIVLFLRTDVVRALQWNGSAWVVIVSEI